MWGKITPMKISPLVLIVAVVIAAVVGAMCERQIQSGKVSHHSIAQNNLPAKLVPPNNFKPLAPSFIVGSEWQEYHAAQKKALADHPDLAAEYKDILNDMAAQQKEVEAAMAKADPKVTPVLAKLDEIRQSGTNSQLIPAAR